MTQARNKAQCDRLRLELLRELTRWPACETISDRRHTSSTHTRDRDMQESSQPCEE